MKLLLLFLLPFSSVTFAWESFCSESNSWRLEWADEFDESILDRSKWNVELSLNSTKSSQVDIAGSCREAACTAQNVYLKNGHLILRSQRENIESTTDGKKYSFTTGAVNSYNKTIWNVRDGPYRMCIAAKLPGSSSKSAAQGIWPAHWLMPNDLSCDPDEGEIDILEMVDGSGEAVQTYHYENTFPPNSSSKRKPCQYPKGHMQQSISQKLPAMWNTTNHEFAVERAIGGPWPGNATNSTKFPVYHSIDYVRVMRKREIKTVFYAEKERRNLIE
eukprot:g683.t1